MKDIIQRLKTENLTDYASIPFWSWNNELNPKELVRQIRRMKDAGCGGFIMHARTGLLTEYLSEEWFHCVEVCLQEAERLGIDYENTFLWLVGLNEYTYGRDVPYTFPLNETDLVADEDRGKLTALESFNEYIKKGYIDQGGDYMLYTHPFAVDINHAGIQEKILPYADPQQHTEAWNAGTHHSICIDNDVVMNWWKDELVPQYKQLSPQGVQFDQGSLTQTVCDMEGHNHGLDAVSRLSSHNKAINVLAQMVRDNLAEEAFILSEATNDITCRYIDIRQNHWLDHPPKWGGEFEYGAIMYTHPQYVYTNCNFMKDSLGNVQNFFLQSAVLGGPVLLTDSGDYALKAEYVRFADSLAENNVPGYPHGYKDDIGLTASTAALFARAYVEGDKVSVLYCANANITNATITVDLEKLGFVGRGVKTLQIENMNGNTASYQIIDVAA